ncbi:TRAFAC clade GTPase domain-containing protein [Paraburkholderia caballeronis]|uniref:Double-GTPase 1 domain-containing protein n=1 Tax=Paraburkholderia caballeronis TaxID=416943 RepID=A0A1H7L8Y6_9BURK|nr:hypothetical protein [Paraburkholderia caballeronis]PXW28341.1 hypothetical protein C7403_102233 [Paraburkholderia caballeronis]PXX03707.1 hypothetical protein C7407_102233 [Paraburkholderia caballeronis]RAK04451.1 hypothetical protein C7409_102233 [Paraburkholderia caballeronis]SED79590.1 hypothetical protein SAMN05445871_3942 [Paraburkholderia caballeronis]SEK95216.1 hypothetical protein SAMN05192542_104233 [Paraburkholderia caballeronis]
MNSGSVMLVGGPGSGKTNYIARLWLAFQARKGALRADRLPTNIHYVNDAVRHLMALKFAPRSERNMEDGRHDFEVEVRGHGGAGAPRKISVPDITGELWRRAVETYELPQEWIDEFKGSSSAILFLRAHTRLNAQPMDWVTARDILQMHAGAMDDELDDDYEDEDEENIAPGAIAVAQPLVATAGQVVGVAEAGQDQSAAHTHAQPKTPTLPAQVGFCELLRYLELLLSDRPDGSRPRVAVVVTAWDMLDDDAKKAGPMQYLGKEFPLFAGRLQTPGRLDIELFGMSIVGGDLRGKLEFRESLKGRDLSEVGYTAVMRDGAMIEDPDVTLPIAWALGD